jgi:hypothetical protein
MAALAYPFFRDTAEVVGRLLALQDDFTSAQVQSRILTTWGDRATTKEAAQKLITTLVDWEVLRSTKTRGHFLLARKMTASVPDLQLWLLEALLGASAADEIEAQQLLRLPESFPFTIGIGVADLRRYDGFDIHRQGLDMDMVAVRKFKLEPPPKPVKKPKKAKVSKPATPTLFDLEGEDVASNNGKPHTPPHTTDPGKTNQASPDRLTERRQIEDSIKNEVLRTLSDRADRFIQVRGNVLVPDSPFAAPSVECAEQFRDGHYFGCIALTQAVLEAVIRHVWQVKLKKKPNQEGSFDKNLEALHKKKIISDEWKSKLDQMWVDRHSFHHLRPSVKADHLKLEETARNTLKLLNDLGREFFGFKVQEGVVLTFPTDKPIREPNQIRQDCARKLLAVNVSDHFQAILGCLLGENWTSPLLVEMVVTSDGHLVGRLEGESEFKIFLGEADDLIKNIHGVASVAELDGDEAGYLVAKVAEIKRRR